MPTPVTPTNAHSHEDGGSEPTVDLVPFEARMRELWEKNRALVAAFCVVVVVAIAGKGGWDYFSAQKERSIEQEFAAASTADKLRAFADLHPGHPLAGVALLSLADGDYASGRIGEAAAGYQRAVDALKTSPLEGRARLGLAMSEIQSGQVSDGVAGLRELVDDTKEFQAVRAEAAYHLASMAAAEGRGEEVQQLSTQLLQIDPNSPWTQRVFALQASLPAAPASAKTPTPGAPAISFPAN